MAKVRLRVGQELRRLREAAALATQYGLLVAAGHGLTLSKLGPSPQSLKLQKLTSATTYCASIFID